MKKTTASSNKKDLTALVRGLKKYNRFMLSCHVLPEGDAIGSLLAMESLLKRMGKKTTIVCQDSFPERLTCLSSKKWKKFADLKGKKPDVDAVLLTDCPSLERIGEVRSVIPKEAKIFNIDHHISNKRFGDYNYIRPDAAATGEVVYDIFQQLKIPLAKEDAKNLYIALATDTGSFKYSNTTARSHEIASALIKTGIDIEKINNELHGTYSLRMMNLYSRLFGRIKTAAHGAIVWAGMKRNDLHESGASYEDTEGFIDFLRYLRKAKIAFFMSELDGGAKIRVSFRAIGSYDVNKLAMSFNGGGHKKASGCILGTSLEEAEERIIQRIKELYNF